MTITWDTSLIGAGSYPDLAAAEVCVNVIFRAHGPEISAFCEGPRKRMRPLRAEFDEEVGTLVNRDQLVVHPRTATLLVHNDGGTPLVFNSCPEEPRPPAPDLASLDVLFGAYFHPDWIDDHDSPLDVLSAFVAENSTQERQRALAELKQLAGTGSEEDRRAAMLGLGSYFVPRPPGQVDAFLAMAIAYLEGAS